VDETEKKTRTTRIKSAKKNQSSLLDENPDRPVLFAQNPAKSGNPSKDLLGE
jgi:hypothetical protein